jgi:inosine/xanthosine triphosphatase
LTASTSLPLSAAGGVASSSLASWQRVRVGSMNAPKIQAVSQALLGFALTPRVEGCGVESGVPEQPVGFDEILRGARNRAEAALASAPCDLAVGIEDGLVTLPGVSALPGGAGATINLGCAWLTDGQRDSFGLSSAFGYPDTCAEVALRERAPIGDLFDELWRGREGAASASSPSGRGIGNIGKLTLGVLTRAEYARHAVVCGLVRYLHPDLYWSDAAQRESADEDTERGAPVST